MDEIHINIEPIYKVDYMKSRKCSLHKIYKIT